MLEQSTDWCFVIYQWNVAHSKVWHNNGKSVVLFKGESQTHICIYRNQLHLFIVSFELRHSVSALQCVKRMNTATWTMLLCKNMFYILYVFIENIGPVNKQTRVLNWIRHPLAYVIVTIHCLLVVDTTLAMSPDIISKEHVFAFVFIMSVRIQMHWKSWCLTIIS